MVLGSDLEITKKVVISTKVHMRLLLLTIYFQQIGSLSNVLDAMCIVFFAIPNVRFHVTSLILVVKCVGEWFIDVMQENNSEI